MNTNLKKLEKQLDYIFKDVRLLQMALTHRSFSTQHNERLEFIGDSLLNCTMALELYRRFPDINEGVMSRVRASLVCQDALHEVALKLGLSNCLRMGDGEIKSGGKTRPSILADAVESILGAIFLDSNDFTVIQKVVGMLFTNALAHVNPDTAGKDAKTQLQEYLQGRHIPLPQYTVMATRGAAHQQEFDVDCYVRKYDLHTSGTANSRRAAEQEAAGKALTQLVEMLGAEKAPQNRKGHTGTPHVKKKKTTDD